MDDIAVSHEEAFTKGAAKAFEHDKREVLALVSAGKAKAIEDRSTPNFAQLSYNIDAYLREQGGANWRETFVPLLQGVIIDQGKYWADRLGMQFNVRNLGAEKWFQEHTLKFAQPINETTSDAVSEILQQATKEGWGVDTLKNRLGQMFDQWMKGDISPETFDWLEARKPQYRLESIARTETVSAANAGSQALFDEWGATEHEWLTVMDGRERMTHAAANGQVKPIKEPFIVGGYKMLHPHDSSLGAPASEIVQCRCSVLPIIAEAKHLAGRHNQQTHGGGGTSEIHEAVNNGGAESFDTVRAAIKKPPKPSNVNDAVLEGMAAEQGFSGRPHVVNKKEMDKHIADGEVEIYRGLSDAKYATAFKEGDYFGGLGTLGSGTYTAMTGSATSKEAAKTAKIYAGKDGAVMRMSIKSGAKTATWDDITAEMAVERKKIQNGSLPVKEKKALLEQVYSNAGRYAMGKGIDVMIAPDQNYAIVLNRTAVRVQE